MSVTIRPALTTDLDALAAIEQRVFAGDRLSPRSMRRHVDSGTALMHVADFDGKAVGYALVFFRAGSATARLYSIAVDPHVAPAGTGRALLAAVEAGAASHGAAAMRLEVRQDNARAIQLYERAGYSRIGKRPGYYADGADALLYRRELGVGAAVAD